MDLVSKSNGLWATLGRFGQATNYPVSATGTKEITVTDAGAALDGATGSILVDGGTGLGEVYTIVSAVSGAGVTVITTVEDLGAVVVTDTICRTKVPEAADNVAVTHNIPGSTSTEIACNNLDLSAANANLACSEASAIGGTVTLSSAYSFTYGTKQVNLRANDEAEGTFSIGLDGRLSAITGDIVGASATLGALTGTPFAGAVDAVITYGGNVTITSISGTKVIADGCRVAGGGLFVDSINGPPGESWVANGGRLVFVQARVGILAKDIRKGVADGTCAVPAAKDVRKGVAVDAGVGTYCRGKGIPRPQPGARR
jgi:hypothetical protein